MSRSLKSPKYPSPPSEEYKEIGIASDLFDAKRLGTNRKSINKGKPMSSYAIKRNGRTYTLGHMTVIPDKKEDKYHNKTIFFDSGYDVTLHDGKHMLFLYDKNPMLIVTFDPTVLSEDKEDDKLLATLWEKKEMKGGAKVSQNKTRNKTHKKR